MCHTNFQHISTVMLFSEIMICGCFVLSCSLVHVELLKIKSGGISQIAIALCSRKSCLLKNSDMMVHLLCQYLFYDPPITITVISIVLCLVRAIKSPFEKKIFFI